MVYDNRENERKSLYKQLKYCRDLMLDLRRASPILAPFNDWCGLIEDLLKRGHKNREVDETLRLIIKISRRQSDPGWNTVLTALFWPTLLAAYRKHFHYDSGCPDELWQDIHWFFIKSVCSIELEDESYPVAIKIYYKIRSSLRDAYESEWTLQNRFPDISQDDFNELADEPCADNLRVHDWIIDLHNLQKKGIISEIDYYLIVESLIHKQSLSDCAFDLGLTYENAKKLRLRAYDKIRNFQRKLSPNRRYRPLYRIEEEKL